MLACLQVVTFGFYELLLPLSGKKTLSAMPTVEGAAKGAVLGVVASAGEWPCDNVRMHSGLAAVPSRPSVSSFKNSHAVLSTTYLLAT